MNPRTIYQDERNMVDVEGDGTVRLCIGSFHGETFTWATLEPDEAVELGNALVAAGAEAGAQCCAEGCCEPATEFGPLRGVDE
jgi:hypothetical protein